MATAAKEPEVKKEEPKAPKNGVMTLYSVYPTYTLVLRQEEATYEPGPSGRRIRIISQEGVTCQFSNHRAYENASFISEILSEANQRTTKKQFWYGFEWITAQDLAELHKKDTKAFDNFVSRMYSMKERHGRQGKETVSSMARQIESELKAEGYLK